jgi:hypothetical protein
MEESRHVAVLSICALVAAIGIAIFAWGSQISGSADANAAVATFGLGRDTVSVTPGVKVSAFLGQPAGSSDGDIDWRLSGIGSAAERIAVQGHGPNVVFTAPTSGGVVLLAHVNVDGEDVTTRTTFDVVSVDAVVGVNVTTRGSVSVDGGRAVQGEALLSGAKIDANHGEIDYMVKATANGTQAGSIRAAGSSFTASARVSGVRVVNTMAVSRSPGGAVRALDAEVEHVDGVRYVEVQTPDVVAMVKGTQFRASTDAAHSWIEVNDGDVDVYDRFRMYIPPQGVGAGESASVEASDFARSVEDWHWVEGSAALDALPSASPDSSPVHDGLESSDDLVDAVVDREVASSAPPPESGTSDGSSPFLASDATATDPGDADEETMDDETTDEDSVADEPEPADNSDDSDDSDDTDTDTGDTPNEATAPTPQPAAKPPLAKPYVLENFAPTRCSDKHMLWNPRAINGKHLCWLKTAVPGVDSSYGYRPLQWGGSFWGCFDRHAKWSSKWCLPVIVDDLKNYIPPYDPPRGQTSTAVGLGDPESMGCLDRKDLTLVHYLWASDGMCHDTAES